MSEDEIQERLNDMDRQLQKALAGIDPRVLAKIASTNEALAKLAQPMKTQLGTDWATPAAVLGASVASMAQSLTWEPPPPTWNAAAKALATIQEQHRAQLATISQAIYEGVSSGLLGAGGVSSGLLAEPPTTARGLADLVDAVSQFARSASPILAGAQDSSDPGWLQSLLVPALPPGGVIPTDLRKGLIGQQREMQALFDLQKSLREWISWGGMLGWAELAALAATHVPSVSLLALKSYVQTIGVADTLLVAVGLWSIVRLGRHNHNRTYGCYQRSIDAPRGPPLAVPVLTVGHQGPVLRRMFNVSGCVANEALQPRAA